MNNDKNQRSPGQQEQKSGSRSEPQKKSASPPDQGRKDQKHANKQDR